MTLTLPPGPAQGFDIVRKNAPMLIGEAVITSLPSDRDPEIGQPWPIYIQKIQTLANGSVIPGSVLAAWQYPIFSGNDILGIAEISDLPPEWAALHLPQYGTRVLDAIRFVESWSAEELYELRLLRVPSASLHTLWLHGADDHFVPINIGGPFEIGQSVLTEANLLESISNRLPERLNATGNRGA